jgi:hypothetical protein
MIHGLGDSIAPSRRVQSRWTVARAISLISLSLLVRLSAESAFAQNATAVKTEPLRRVRVESPRAPELAAELHGLGFDVLQPTVTQDSLETIVGADDLAELQRRGLKIETLEIARPFNEIQAERAAAEAALGLPPSDPAYLDLAAILARMDAVASAHPSLAQVVDLTDRYGAPQTFGGRHIFAVKISDNVAVEEDEPRFLVVANHHAREIVTPVIALELIDLLTTEYATDADARALVDGAEIWVVPVWNPDGYDYVFTGENLWRKNRRVFATGTGVDLNRNYPEDWSGACGGSTNVNSETYRGPSAASEAETQLMLAFGDDRRFAKVADLHSHARDVRYSYASCRTHPFNSWLRDEAAVLASAASYVVNTSCCTGGNFGWHLARFGSHSFLWETASEFQPTHAAALAEADRVIPSILALLRREMTFSGRVTNALGGAPIAATIRMLGVNFVNGESHGSDATFGRYHLFMPAGAYQLEFSAPGFQTRVFHVQADAALGQIFDVQLLPVGFVSAAKAWTWYR